LIIEDENEQVGPVHSWDLYLTNMDFNTNELDPHQDPMTTLQEKALHFLDSLTLEAQTPRPLNNITAPEP